MFWIITNRRKINEIRDESKKGFESVKKDIISISEWIKHLDDETNSQETDINSIKSVLSNINEEIAEIKNKLAETKTNSLFETNSRPFKTKSIQTGKQTTVFNNQTAVLQAVQTLNLANFSITERAIISVLINSDLKLSYEDLAAMLGKTKSTIRGQINTIKSKSESLIQEIIEKNGKKRLFIPEKIKAKLLKKTKVRA